MVDHQHEWLIEFVHQYDDGYVITKRGLDASPIVIKKYGLGPDEVMAFSCHQRAHKAMTAFHFHPDFPADDREPYMRRHDEGHEVAADIGSPVAAQRQQMRRVLEERVTRLGRGVALGVQSAALYLVAGGPIAR